MRHISNIGPALRAEFKRRILAAADDGPTTWPCSCGEAHPFTATVPDDGIATGWPNPDCYHQGGLSVHSGAQLVAGYKLFRTKQAMGEASARDRQRGRQNPLHVANEDYVPF